MAPRAIAAGMPMPGISSQAAPATAAVETTTRATASMIRVRQRTRKTAQELRCAVANSSGGRKIGRISSGGISSSGKPGMKVSAAARMQHQHRIRQPQPVTHAHGHHGGKQESNDECQLVHVLTFPGSCGDAIRSGCAGRLPYFIGNAAGNGAGPAAAVSAERFQRRGEGQGAVPELDGAAGG